jgi:predicted secreted hydrolase
MALAALLLGACAADPAETGRPVGVAVAEAMGGGEADGFARATEMRQFVFPEDFGPHEEFRTEWWYLTGNLADDADHEFGFQLTIFRHALKPTAPVRSSRWTSRDIWFAHLALGDGARGRFTAHERFERGALGLAGARARPFAAWVGDWRIESVDGNEALPIRVVAGVDEVAIDLVLDPRRPIVLQGDRGLSRKGPEPGNASFYFSVTRLAARGSVMLKGTRHDVTGSAWFDREWSTSALSEGQVGWDWFAIQFDDGRELMLYRLRRANGTTDPYNSGTLIGTDGAARRLGSDEISFMPGRRWTSPRSGASYPVEWLVSLEPFDLELEVIPMIDASELDVVVRYWEGAIRVRGREGSKPVSGRGFLEMTGYEDADETKRKPLKGARAEAARERSSSSGPHAGQPAVDAENLAGDPGLLR